ncbi:hypothetical protein like AT5G18150 [Hibiscus trionum]|uniref:Uncharacterized protein n=1 Tax=Hibiscus trionum TaxID=183268 RepID=A0A9W7HWX7_HIBTR|nr:hypothetical protein like AT5G18150 [Hibiscus trionum]
MCPLRFVLVFFSAVLAGYVAWRMVRSSSHIDSSGSAVSENSGKMVANDKPELNSKRNGFWASGRYWWRN